MDLGGDIWTKSRDFSNIRLGKLRESLRDVVPGNLLIVTFGSYARREASVSSDLDYISIVDAESVADNFHVLDSKVLDTLKSVVPIDPSSTGAFGGVVSRTSMLSNFGGDEDTNQTITRRVLLLLEGEWLTAESKFELFRRAIIERYVEATPRDHQLALFLLNDVIRYWRTMTVDFAYKTDVGGKPWAIRNIKLMFSRKLMYASGLFSIATTANASKSDKIEQLNRLFSLPVIDRLEDVCGTREVSRVRESYGRFLEVIESEKNREALKTVTSANRDDPVFRKIKNEGHLFTRELLSLFERTFHTTHPIHRAVIF